MYKRYVILLPITLYLLLFIPFISLIPGNDGSLELNFSDFWLLNQNRLQLISLHPPFKLILFSTLYQVFGYHSIGFIGLLFGILGIIAMYYVAKKIFDESVALLSSVLLATSGLYISVGIFSIHDFLMTVLILISLAFYLRSKYVWYAIFVCLAVLTKETAIFYAVAILLSDFFVKKNIKFATFTPIIILAWYIEFVHFSGNHLWNDWNFSNTSKDGSALTMILNVVTLQMFNKYAYENWLHLFIFNFNWVYWIFTIISFYYIKTSEMKKNLIPIALYFFIFTILVLSFQTFTINRYVLPLLPFVYMLASYGACKVKFNTMSIVILVLISFISLFTSIDPLSNLIWQKTPLLGENIYLNKNLDGYDGITYNMQYIDIMQKRDAMIRVGHCAMSPLIAYSTQTLNLYNIHTCK